MEVQLGLGAPAQAPGNYEESTIQDSLASTGAPLPVAAVDEF